MSTIHCPKCDSTNVCPRTAPQQKNSLFKRFAEGLFGEEFVEAVTDVTSSVISSVLDLDTGPYQCNNCGHTWLLLDHESQNIKDRLEALGDSYVSENEDLKLDAGEMCPECGTRFHLDSEDSCPSCGHKWSSTDQNHWTTMLELDNAIPEITPAEKLKKIEHIIEFFEKDGLTLDSLNFHLFYAYYLKSVMYSTQHNERVLEGNYKDADIYRRKAKSNIVPFLKYLDSPTIKGKKVLKNMIDIIYNLSNPFDKIKQRLISAESDIETYRQLVRETQNIKRYNNELSEYKSLDLTFIQTVNPSDRSIIFIGDQLLDDLLGCTNPNNIIDYIFLFPSIPADIQFYLGKPKLNTLYIVNPVKPNEYIPYEKYEYILFMDKIRELKRLLRYLGATEITFTSMRGASFEEFQMSSWNASAEGSFKIPNADGEVTSNKQFEKKSSRGQTVDHIEKLNPFRYPSLPQDLHWYESDPEWKDIVEARLHHNQLHFEQSISTKQVSSLDEQSQRDVNSAYENLLLKINTRFHTEREFHVKTTEETMWRITAEFKPLSEFVTSDSVETAQKSFTRNEQKYIAAVKRYLGDSGISERDRKKLNLLLKPLGISKEHADELEASLVPHLSEGEKEYLKAVRVYKEDGIINESDRLTLEEIRVAYSISENRARQLESMV